MPDTLGISRPVHEGFFHRFRVSIHHRQVGAHGAFQTPAPFKLWIAGYFRYNQGEVKGMATETITIQVDREAARAYKAAAPRDQRKMGALLSLWLKDVAMAEPAALKQMMTDLSKKARDRGLTPEILENLLKEA
jgi:hypothetical protein